MFEISEQDRNEIRLCLSLRRDELIRKRTRIKNSYGAEMRREECNQEISHIEKIIEEFNRHG